MRLIYLSLTEKKKDQIYKGNNQKLSNFIFLFFCLFWSYSWLCSRVIPGSVLRNYSCTHSWSFLHSPANLFPCHSPFCLLGQRCRHAGFHSIQRSQSQGKASQCCPGFQVLTSSKGGILSPTWLLALFPFLIWEMFLFSGSVNSPSPPWWWSSSGLTMLTCHLAFHFPAPLQDEAQFSLSWMPGILKGPKQQWAIICQVSFATGPRKERLASTAPSHRGPMKSKLNKCQRVSHNKSPFVIEKAATKIRSKAHYGSFMMY